MDIYKFINSKDIRAYLKQTGYQFSSLETAWIIRKSKYTTLGEKHDAWRELIETMPDCEIEERPNTRPQPSLLFDVYGHGYGFVPFGEDEKDNDGKRFKAGTDHTIRTRY